jgi:hypothetical protein
VNHTVLDHAACLLEREPTRCLTARALHDRATRDTGSVLPFDRFLAILAQQPDRFTVIAPPPAFAGLSAYDTEFIRTGFGTDGCDQALAASGTIDPLIALNEHDDGIPLRVDLELRIDPALPDGSSGSPADDVLATVHEALARVLRHSGDAGLLDAAGAGLQELHAMRQELRRSRTLHHCSSASSASVPKPPAAAAARMRGASSSRMPDRIAQPPGRSAP